MSLPLMQKATAVWLVDNTTLTFRQISQFCGLHELEVTGIADGEVAIGIKGFDPIANNQLTAEEIKRCEADPKANLKLMFNPAAEGETKRKGPRYTPLSKRQDRPAAIAWLVKFHPELADSQISKLVGTTKPTITSIRERTHWNINNIQPVDPVALGLTKQVELDAAVAKAAAKAANEGKVLDDAERMKLVSTEQSLAMDDEPRMPSSIAGLETFTLGGSDEEEKEELDANTLFNLPESSEDDKDQP
ncbi:MAG: cell cycle transcriptional regulator TrcR [Pseudomonadota bacterium]